MVETLQVRAIMVLWKISKKDKIENVICNKVLKKKNTMEVTFPNIVF